MKGSHHDGYEEDYFSPKYVFHSGKNAEKEKLEGLYIEPERIAQDRFRREVYHERYVFLIPPGLRGARRAVQILRSYYSRNYHNIPYFLKNVVISSFTLSAGVIWKAWTLYQYDSNQNSPVLIGEIDDIRAESSEMSINLGRICAGGHQARENGGKHYVDIQKVLNENWPELYEVKELNGG